MGRRLSVILGAGLAAVLLHRRREELASKLILRASVADALGFHQDRVADDFPWKRGGPKIRAVKYDCSVVMTVRDDKAIRFEFFAGRVNPSKPPGCRSSCFGREAAIRFVCPSGRAGLGTARWPDA